MWGPSQRLQYGRQTPIISLHASVSLFCHIIIPDLISDMIHKIASSEGRQQQHLALTASHPPLSRSWPRSDSVSAIVRDSRPRRHL